MLNGTSLTAPAEQTHEQVRFSPDWYLPAMDAGDKVAPSPRPFNGNNNNSSHHHRQQFHAQRMSKLQSASTAYLRAKGAPRYSRPENGEPLF